jgi:hypothetical protein
VSSPTTSRIVAANPLRINTSSTPRICIKINDFNPIRIRTYNPSNLTHKTKDFNPTGINTYALRPSKTFRINTYKNKGEGAFVFISINIDWRCAKSIFVFNSFQHTFCVTHLE